MGLSGDQKALLRLLAQREQGYEDIASLMGLSVEEVRARVKDALEAVEREGGEAPPAPAEPGAEAPLEKKPEPAAERAPEPKPRPATPPPDVPPRAAAVKKPKPQRPALPKERRVLAIAGGLGAIVLVIVLLATGMIGGGDSSSDAGSSGSDSGSESRSELTKAEEAVANAKDLTKAVLNPVDGSDAHGIAIFGRLKNRLALQIQAEGLEPTGNESSYTVWLTQSPERRLPLASTRVPESGQISAQVEVPAEILAYLAKGTFDELTLSLTDDAQLKDAVEAAAKASKAPAYTGTDVLQGKITGPIVGAAGKAEKGK